MFCTWATHITRCTHTHTRTCTHKHTSIYTHILEKRFCRWPGIPSPFIQGDSLNPDEEARTHPSSARYSPNDTRCVAYHLGPELGMLWFALCVHTHDPCSVSSSNCLKMLTTTRVHVADCQRVSLSTRLGGWWILKHLCYTSID